MNLKEYDLLVLPCSGTKRDYACAAQELYDRGSLFRVYKQLADLAGVPWMILSSNYGLIEKTSIVEPYSLVWSKKTLQGVKSMRPLIGIIPTLTETERQARADYANELTKGKRVLCFCSTLSHKEYFPDWKFFITEIGKDSAINNRGIQLIMGTVHRLTEELKRAS